MTYVHSLYIHYNNYQDINQYVFPKYRELCQKYGFTILLIHHLNKNNTSLGSTAIDGAVDGIITLKKDIDRNTTKEIAKNAATALEIIYTRLKSDLVVNTYTIIQIIRIPNNKHSNNITLLYITFITPICNLIS